PRPDEIPELFPHIRLMIFNTYNHTEEAPRFRVVVPLTRPLSPENYELLYDNIIAKIKDAGYSVGQSKSTRRSGLDVGKKSAACLFYLHCQARDSTQSFFKDYNVKREILDPYVWLQNTVVPFPAKSAMQRPEPSQNVDQAAVEAATSEWRQSRNYP